MIQVPTKQASAKLDELLDEAAHGQDVVIIGTNGSAFKLVHLPHAPKPVFGSARGLVEIGPDFDEPLDPFDRLMVAQAIHEDMTLITKDQTLGAYDVRTAWSSV